MAGGGEEEGVTLEYTPTWVVAAVCTIIVGISLFVERLLHYSSKYLKRKNQKSLFEALQHLLRNCRLQSLELHWIKSKEHLLEIMGEFNLDQQRAFCQFVIGAPRLPPGALAVLNPKLTIVRKHSSTSNNNVNNATGLSKTAMMTCQV